MTRREIRVAASPHTTRPARVVRIRRNDGAARIELGLGQLGGRILSTSLTPEESRKIGELLLAEADAAEAILRERAEDGR